MLFPDLTYLLAGLASCLAQLSIDASTATRAFALCASTSAPHESCVALFFAVLAEADLNFVTCLYF